MDGYASTSYFKTHGVPFWIVVIHFLLDLFVYFLVKKNVIPVGCSLLQSCLIGHIFIVIGPNTAKTKYFQHKPVRFCKVTFIFQNFSVCRLKYKLNMKQVVRQLRKNVWFPFYPSLNFIILNSQPVPTTITHLGSTQAPFQWIWG
jgi:hypothetical protein